jgi:hypothetical protein
LLIKPVAPVVASISFAIVELLGPKIKRCPPIATKYCNEKKKMKSSRASYYHYSENERRVELL